MGCQQLRLVGVVVVLSVGLAGCGGSGKSSTSTTSAGWTTAAAGGAVLAVAKRGVVTIAVATVGDPGNPSVGVWQVFKTVGTSGAGVTLPPDNSTGIYDMAGPVVEHTDSLAPQPAGYHFLQDWRYYHGGVANAPAYQIAIYGFGYFPGRPASSTNIYPWMGLGVGVIGDLK